MFNTPTRSPPRQFSNSNSNGFGSMTGSFFSGDPLASSTYDGVDPWSSAPTPDPPPPGAASTASLSSVIADASTPPIYHKALQAVDPSGSGEISINSLSRVLLTSGLSASAIDKIVNLVSSRHRVTKLEFFVALALVGLAQEERELSIEHVASLAAQNSLPVPSLDLDAVGPQGASSRRGTVSQEYRVVAQASYSQDDPWQNPEAEAVGSLTNGAPSSISGTGLPRDWWKRQEQVQVRLAGLHGFVLNRFMLYEVSTERGTPVQRRYSEFVYLWDCLVRRYPFRILPQLPPKRIGPDESFLEQRRRGLQRFLKFVMNHPILREDGLLAVFLTEPSLEQWRKHSSVALEEEALTKRLDKIEEMSIPSDLEDKLKIVRSKLNAVIEQWQKICLLAERLTKRREAAAVRDTHALFKRAFLSSILTPSVPPSIGSCTSSRTSSESSSPVSLASSILPVYPSGSLLGSFATTPLVGSMRPDGNADGGFYTSYWENPQADLSRLSLTLNTLNEVNSQCWRGDACELCTGVRAGLGEVSSHVARQSEESDQRARRMTATIVEALKSQRDLYIAMRDLFLRHQKLSCDNVEVLKKRIETAQSKLEGIRITKKEGWTKEAERLTNLIERDQTSIALYLQRRVYIRYCMWHELRVVLHNRENTLITQAVQDFAREESAFSESLVSKWSSLADAVEQMPYE